MAIHIKPKMGTTPGKLWGNISNAIRQGKIDTWIIDEDDDLTHAPNQWFNQAWFRHYCSENELEFGILSRNDREMSTLVYGLYHGRFAEMLLVHFDKDIENITISSLPERGVDSLL